jgi:uncharacterized protein (TIGR02266 family)
MSYSGAAQASESRKLLSAALEALQKDPNIPQDVLSVVENVAQAIGALFEAERASSDGDGRASVRAAMGSLSQTMALLQDVRGKHDGIRIATTSLAEAMGKLFPLAQMPTTRPNAAVSMAPVPTIPKAGKVPSVRPAPSAGPRTAMEANVGATTESNFYVGFSGEISEGGVFVATYNVLPLGTLIEVLVTLPGGFEAKLPGKVRFVRDPMDFSMDSEPGVGVAFEALPDKDRELILRFIRKRPPLFYDD